MRWRRDRGGGVPTAIITEGGLRAQAACALDVCWIDIERRLIDIERSWIDIERRLIDIERSWIDIERAVGGAHWASFAWEEAMHIHGLQDVSAAMEVSSAIPDQLSEYERAIPTGE
jgi:hypothetical protein